MNKDNVYDLLIAVVFAIIPQLGGLGPKSQDLVISLHIGEVEIVTKFYPSAVQIRSEMFLLQDETGRINNPTGEHIMLLSKLKHLKQ